MSLEEGTALRLALLQSASLRAITAIMNCPRYAEMLLIPRASHDKVSYIWLALCRGCCKIVYNVTGNAGV